MKFALTLILCLPFVLAPACGSTSEASTSSQVSGETSWTSHLVKLVVHKAAIENAADPDARRAAVLAALADLAGVSFSGIEPSADFVAIATIAMPEDPEKAHRLAQLLTVLSGLGGDSSEGFPSGDKADAADA